MKEFTFQPSCLPALFSTRAVSCSESSAVAAGTARDALTEVLQRGACRLLTEAIDGEVDEWIERHKHLSDERGRRQVVRNGHKPERSVLTGIGPVPVRQPRVHDRRPPGEAVKFRSAILPPYLRKTRALEELIPWLYLRGVSTGDFSEALAALTGADAAGLSATTISRLVTVWQKDLADWRRRSLAGKQYVYVWADGIYFNIRLEDAENSKQCILVLMGATPEGQKELIAIQDGHRESEASWLGLLLDCKQRGLTIDPKLAIADGGLGFWSALPQAYPSTREQRCWVHKMVNVLDKLPKGVQGLAKEKMHDIWMAETRAAAEKAFDRFLAQFRAKHLAAVECLEKDRVELLTFYDFPAEHWLHLRTTNPIESTFATVRLRHRKTKGNGSRVACLTMVFKLCEAASKTWRLLNGSALLPEVIAGVTFVDGIRKTAA